MPHRRQEEHENKVRRWSFWKTAIDADEAWLLGDPHKMETSTKEMITPVKVPLCARCLHISENLSLTASKEVKSYLHALCYVTVKGQQLRAVRRSAASVSVGGPVRWQR